MAAADSVNQDANIPLHNPTPTVTRVQGSSRHSKINFPLIAVALLVIASLTLVILGSLNMKQVLSWGHTATLGLFVSGSLGALASFSILACRVAKDKKAVEGHQLKAYPNSDSRRTMNRMLRTQL